MYKIAIFLLFAIFGTSRAQFISSGACNFTSLVYHREVATGLENYSEIRRIINTWNSGHCASWHLSMRNDGMFIRSREVVLRKAIQRNATANPNIDGSFKAPFADFSSNFTLLGVGNDFAVLYACSNIGNSTYKKEYAWVLGRTTTLSTSARNVTENILNNNNLSNASWVVTSHSQEACRTGGANNLQISIIALIFGFVISKGL